MYNTNCPKDTTKVNWQLKSVMLAVINCKLLDIQKGIANVVPSLPYEVRSLRLLLRQ